jgi:hypothetical protein
MDFSAHQRKFPPDIAEYFRSTWDTHELWRLEAPRRPIRIADLEWHLDYPFCSSEPPAPLFDLTPRAVLESPREFPQHWRRVLHADLSFPIHVSAFGRRWVILDGIHRLVSAIAASLEVMECKIVPREHLRISSGRAGCAPVEPVSQFSDV